MSKIIVGVDGSDRSDGALALASRLARPTCAEIVLARVYPYDDAAAHLGDSARRRLLRKEAQEILDRMREHADPSLRIVTRTIADLSPARALHTLAERERASLMVIASSHRGAVGRVFAGTTAERLLHGAPCPVAVAPRGPVSGESISRIVAGWDRWSIESMAAVYAATAIARALQSELRVLGSRGYGPHRAVLLGGVSGRLMRRSACPVIVVPRGNQAPLEDLFRAAAQASADT